MGEKQEIPKEPVQGGPENKGENKPGEKPGDKPGDKPAEKVKVVSPEVLDLAEKVAGDPKSRLFVKLAEEYLKSEMVDEAIAALNDGLKNHPSFFAAKVMLGRALLEKGDIAEAKATFEGVVSVNPDNLLAQRKLAGIYKDEGNIGAGRSAAQAVLALNPKDEEMLEVVKALDELEEASGHGGLVDIASGAADSDFVMPLEQTSHTPAERSTETEGGPGKEGTGSPQDAVAPVEAGGGGIPESPMDAMMDAGGGAGMQTSTPPAEVTSEPPPAKQGLEGSPVEAQTPPAPPAAEPKAESDTPKMEGVSEFPGTETPTDSPLEPIGEKGAGPGAGDVPPAEASSSAQSLKPGPSQAPPSEPEKINVVPPVQPQPVQGKQEEREGLEEIKSEAMADLYIKQGHYDKGVAILRKLLADDPANQDLHKKLEEAVTIVRKQSKKESSSTRAGGPEAVSPQGKPAGPAPTEGAGGKGAQKNDKIDRLQSWLDSIKKGQKG